MDINKTLNKNNIYNSIATFTNFLFPIITFPYAARVLGVDNIGKYNFSNSIVSYFNLIATLGISSYAIRECAKVKNNREKLNEISSEIYSIDIYSTIVAYILLFITLLISVKLKSYTTYILLLGSSFAINTIGTTWICNAVDDFKYLSIRTVLIHIFTLLGLFLFVKNEKHLYIYILLLVIPNFATNFYCIFYRKKYVDIKFNPQPNIGKHLRKIILLFSQNVSMLLYTNADIIMLGYYYNDGIVGYYSLSVRIYNIVNGVIASVIGVATPGLSYDYNIKDYNSFNNKLTYVVDYILLLFIPAFIGLNILAPEIIKLVAGQSFELSIISLRILTIAMLFSLISAVLGLAILFPMGYDRINFNSCIISAISNIVLNIYFVPKFGVVGAAITTAIAELLGFINKIKHIDKNIKIYKFPATFIKYLFGSLLTALICILYKKLFVISNVNTIFTILIGGITYFVYLIIIKDNFFINLIQPVLVKAKIIKY